MVFELSDTTLFWSSGHSFREYSTISEQIWSGGYQIINPFGGFVFQICARLATETKFDLVHKLSEFGGFSVVKLGSSMVDSMVKAGLFCGYS